MSMLMRKPEIGFNIFVKLILIRYVQERSRCDRILVGNGRVRVSTGVDKFLKLICGMNHGTWQLELNGLFGNQYFASRLSVNVLLRWKLSYIKFF